MVSLEKYTAQRATEVRELSVLPEQVEFTVSDIDKALAQLTDSEHPHLIVFDDRVVGFFIFDLNYAANHSFSSHNTIGVRSLLVDQRYQGRGIAGQAISLMPDYAKGLYPEFERLQLTVNCRNKAAYSCYLKYGFEDTGELYLGGPVGPQHIMQCRLV